MANEVKLYLVWESFKGEKHLMNIFSQKNKAEAFAEKWNTKEDNWKKNGMLGARSYYSVEEWLVEE